MPSFFFLPVLILPVALSMEREGEAKDRGVGEIA